MSDVKVSSYVADPAEAQQLAGKIVLVTGGASGLGAALCHVLSSSGATVVVGDLNLDKAQTVASLLEEAGAKAHAIGFNVGDPVAAERAIEESVSRFGRLDVLINNAGTDVTLPIEELSFNDWDRVMRTNLYGPFLLSKYAARHMKDGGQIVNIASTAAKRAWPNASAYHASKWGLLGLSHALHAELRPRKIKVTAVLAGGMRTPFLLDRFPDIDINTLQDPVNVAKAVKGVLLLPEQTVIPEVMVLPMQESSWP
ncbi:SDR family oxidoreductase [Noviherbaspirillum sp. CPCC 100848]|uniref:SDR family oxidoreductase n=1 Tax=Noviherbaspirillum album TaxID=3080276 RepID=A0ABU6J7G0_9BURK|nr:SDR family oxidoreductase [Noviherbaspirillum sp. CPCC 100848]MEC4719546.1 SDR family oxidoreductase [Noviherbaspirillum sp. CPCC 100848]